MLLVLPQKRIVSRIIRSKTGELAVAYFLVAEFEGQIFWKLVKIEKSDSRFKIQDLRTVKAKNLCLPGAGNQKTIYDLRFTANDYQSPYFSNIDSFFKSQMTRAPSLAF